MSFFTWTFETSTVGWVTRYPPIQRSTINTIVVNPIMVGNKLPTLRGLASVLRCHPNIIGPIQ